MLARRIPRGGTGGFTLPPSSYAMLYNGTATNFDYDIGLARSADGGVTWTPDAGNPVLTRGANGTWDDDTIVDPSVVWDGSQWVMLYAGHNGSIFQIGMATSSDLETWTKSPSNPILTPGAGYTQMNFPTAYYDAANDRIQFLYAGWKAGGALTMGYAEIDSGGSVSGIGEVMGLGSSGQFDDVQVVPGAIVKEGSTFYVHYTGYDGTYYHSGVATTSALDGTYTKLGVLSGYSGDVVVGGITYHSNQVRSVVKRGGGYICHVTVFHSGDGTEAMAYDTASGPGGPLSGSPSGPLIPLGSGWDSNSAENPTVVAA